MNEIAQWFCIFLLVVDLFLQKRMIREQKKRIEGMIKARQTFYESLTDQDAIMADMERGSVAMEALAAKRRRNVREDAGPHARIYRPKKQRFVPRKYRDSVSFDE